MRLVLTQPAYILQSLLAGTAPETKIILTASRSALSRLAPEADLRGGPWRHFTPLDIDEDPGHSGGPVAVEWRRPVPVVDITAEEELLVRAYTATSAQARLNLCLKALAVAPRSEVAALALAGAWREAQDQSAWREALDRALAIDPEWAAAHFEDGKFWLSCDDMERARSAFQRAAELMPSFSAAWSNLGSTLGELDRPDAAVTAFTQALMHDPDNPAILNNIGVVSRELGRLDDSERALLRVVALAPEFVFGHYNLGHTRLLRGDYAGALVAYEEGQRRDPQKNRRQGCRLAIVRLANQDLAGAERDLWTFANQAPPDEREDLLLEAYETAHSLASHDPGIQAAGFLSRIAAEVTR